MKGFKKLVIICLVISLVLCLVGCLRVDMGVVIREDGTASLTSKLMMEEDAYLTLVSFGPSGDGSVEEAGEDEDSVDLTEFQKETIDGEVFYTFEETIEVGSFEELEQFLVREGDEDGVDLLSSAKVTQDGNVYSFEAVTTKMEDASASMGTDWVTLTLTVTMPGEIVETTGEQLNENTVRFVLDDFSEAKTLMVQSKVPLLSVGQIVAVVACSGILVACSLFLIVRNAKAKKHYTVEN